MYLKFAGISQGKGVFIRYMILAPINESIKKKMSKLDYRTIHTLAVSQITAKITQNIRKC